MTGRKLFDPGPPHPKNDAAPLAGGAGVKAPTDANQCTQPTLTSPARQIAPVGAGGIANPMTGYDKGLRTGVLATPIRQDSPSAISHDTGASRSTLPRTIESRRGELLAQGPEMRSGGCRGTASSFVEAAWLTHDPASPATIAPDTSRGSAGSAERGRYMKTPHSPTTPIDWLTVAADSDLPPSERLLFYALIRFANHRSGRCHPSQAKLAEATGLHPDTVGRKIAELVNRGFVAVERHASGRGSNSYRLRLPSAPDKPNTDEATPGAESEVGVTVRRGTPDPAPGLGAGVSRGSSDPVTGDPRHKIGPPPAQNRTNKTKNRPVNTTTNTRGVVDVFPALGIESLRGHPNATPERLAWIEREAPSKTNPGGWAAQCIREGWSVPPPGPTDVAAARKVDRGARLAAFDAMPPSERAAIIAAARAAFPNLASEPDESPGVRGAVLRVLPSRESNGTSASLRPPRDLPSRPLERHP